MENKEKTKPTSAAKGKSSVVDLNCPVIDAKGSNVGSLNLSPDIFSTRINATLVHTLVRWQRAKKRAGTHSCLTRTMMKGGGKKPFKQKGTGNARAGSSVSPLWVGGASIHGPSPRNYEFSLNKRDRLAAICSMLTHRLKRNNIHIVDKFPELSGKTKELVSFISGMGLKKNRVLILDECSGNAGCEVDASKSSKVAGKRCSKLVQASKNIPGFVALKPSAVNVYDLVYTDAVIGSKQAIEKLQSELLNRVELLKKVNS